MGEVGETRHIQKVIEDQLQINMIFVSEIF